MKPELQVTVREAAQSLCWQCRHTGDPVWIESYSVHEGKQVVDARALRHPYANGQMVVCSAEGLWKLSEVKK